MSGEEANSHFLVIHPGGLGDLVLLSELIGSLKQAHPECGLTLVCRAEFTAVTDCYPVPPDKVVGLPFQPYAWAEPAEELHIFLQSILLQFAGRRIVALVDAGLRPNWLADFLTASLEPAVAIRCSQGVTPPVLLTDLLEQFCLAPRSLRNLTLPAGIHERDRYRLLLETLESPFMRTLPWSLAAEWKRPAIEWLGHHHLEPGKYLACAPFGAASTPVKRWPMDRFVDVIQRFSQESNWPVVLMGDQNEDESLVAMESRLFDIPTAILAGRPEELPLVAGILSMAGAYLSNDAGLMHLAQAYEIPGAAIFGGGGEWPAYAPWAPGSAGLCHPLPCFGCGWDCFLGHGLCVESIPVENVYEALVSVCLAPTRPPHNVILQIHDEALLGLVADASERYREAELDRSKRLQVIADLERLGRQWPSRERDLLIRLKETEARAAEMERIAGERLAVLERVHLEAARRLELMREIGEQSEARRQSVEQLSNTLARNEAAWFHLEQALRPAERANSQSSINGDPSECSPSD